MTQGALLCRYRIGGVGALRVVAARSDRRRCRDAIPDGASCPCVSRRPGRGHGGVDHQGVPRVDERARVGQRGSHAPDVRQEVEGALVPQAGVAARRRDDEGVDVGGHARPGSTTVAGTSVFTCL